MFSAALAPVICTRFIVGHSHASVGFCFLVSGASALWLSSVRASRVNETRNGYLHI
jgi:hypothetical protein